MKSYLLIIIEIWEKTLKYGFAKQKKNSKLRSFSYKIFKLQGPSLYFQNIYSLLLQLHHILFYIYIFHVQ